MESDEPAAPAPRSAGGAGDHERARTTADDARAPLALVDGERRAVADRVRAARWYAPLYGAVLALLVLVPAAPLPVMPVLYGAGMLALAGLVTTYRQVTGVWVSPANPGAPRGPAVAVGCVAVAAFVAVILSTRVWHAPAVAVASAVLAGLAGAVLSRAFDLRWAATVEQG